MHWFQMGGGGLLKPLGEFEGTHEVLFTHGHRLHWDIKDKRIWGGEADPRSVAKNNLHLKGLFHPDTVSAVYPSALSEGFLQTLLINTVGV